MTHAESMEGLLRRLAAQPPAAPAAAAQAAAVEAAAPPRAPPGQAGRHRRCAYQPPGGLGGTPRANPATVAAGTAPRVRTAALRGKGARRTPS